MTNYNYVTVDVFTEERFGGNPLAVFPDASGLTEAQMQAIAAEFNLSETTFVLPPADPRNHARVRIFAPGYEMPFAGHPNVGTGYVLAQLAGDPPEHFTFEEIAGLVRVHVLRDAAGAVAGARIAAPHALSLDAAVPTEMLAECLGLAVDDFITEVHQPLIASVGIPFVIAELGSRDALGRAQPDLAAFRDAAERFPLTANRFAVYLYTRRGEDFLHLQTRMFAPLTGLMEDPATGSAAGALAALLTSLAPGENVDLHFDIEQGYEMGRPSQIIASARKTGEGPVLATISGSCVNVMRGTLEV